MQVPEMFGKSLYASSGVMVAFVSAGNGEAVGGRSG